MSTFDQYQLVRRQEQQPETIIIDAQGTELPAGSNGYGNVLGVVAIVIGVVTLPITGGVSILGIIAGAFMFGGERVTDSACKAMSYQATQRNPQGVNQTAATGCCQLIIWLVLLVVVIALVAVALGSVGMMPGCKVCGG